VFDALPHSVDYLCVDCGKHFEEVQDHLNRYGQVFTISHRLVRGLDYYTRTTFELVQASLGAQNALLGGGRYDGLVKQLGGPDRAGIGFAAGLERLVLALPENRVTAPVPDAFVASFGEDVREEAFIVAKTLRDAGLRTLIDYDRRSAKSQMKRADRAGARYVVIVGGDELARGEVTLKDMTTGEQRAVARELLLELLKTTEPGQ
jgi:histidyl-tRNA synthetase